MISLDSIQKPQGSEAGHWRIASALVPVAIAELTVTREESRDLAPAHMLLLETIRLIEEEKQTANIRDVANFCGIENEATMASIVVPLAESGLLVIEEENLRQNPGLTVEGATARLVVDEVEQICVIGTPPIPARMIEPGRIHRLKAFESDGQGIAVSDDTLEEWRKAFWDRDTQRLRLNQPLTARLYVLEQVNAAGCEYALRDNHRILRFELPIEHPFARELDAKARMIRQAAGAVLGEYGEWHERGELRCNGEQWLRWRALGGREHGEAILREAIDVGTDVRCQPIDAEAARAMLFENILFELDQVTRDFTVELVTKVATQNAQSALLKEFQFAPPTVEEIEFTAWEKGRWELAYRVGAPGDGL